MLTFLKQYTCWKYVHTWRAKFYFERWSGDAGLFTWQNPGVSICVCVLIGYLYQAFTGASHQEYTMISDHFQHLYGNIPYHLTNRSASLGTVTLVHRYCWAPFRQQSALFREQSALFREHSALSREHSALSREHSVLSREVSAPFREYWAPPPSPGAPLSNPFLFVGGAQVR
jgi:hypothetical protein